MKAYKINKYIICADVLDDAKAFFCHEIGEPLPQDIEELDVYCEVSCESGETRTIRDIINRELDERSAWLRMSIPCDLHFPFIAVKLPRDTE